MTQPEITDDAPGSVLFPQFQTEIYEMFRQEVAGLTDEQLDWEPEHWGWSQWSISRNLSHVASGDFRGRWPRWGAPLVSPVAGTLVARLTVQSPWGRNRVVCILFVISR